MQIIKTFSKIDEWCLVAAMACIIAVTARAQNAQISISGGMSRVNFVSEGSVGAELRYLFDNDYIIGLRASSTLMVPMRIDRISGGFAETERYEGTSTVNTLMLDIGWRESFGRFSMLGGISGGGVNVAHQRILGYVTVFSGGDGYQVDFYETYAQPSFAFGGWLTMQLRVGDSWLLGLGGTFDYSENQRTIATNAQTGAEYRAVFAGPQARAFLSVGKDLGVPKMSDTSHPHWWLLTTITSLHPFSDRTYNQFNPGIGVHVRFDPGEWTWFGEAAVYQYSLSDRAIYAGGGIYYSLVGNWLKVGVLGGVLSLANPTGIVFSPALSPRLTADTKLGSVTVLFIPAWSESAFGLTLHLPLF